MNERTWKAAQIICIIGACTAFYRISWGLGFLLGAAAAVLLYKRNESYWNEVVDGGSAGKHTGTGHFLVNYAMMASVLILSAFVPKIFNIFACALGLALIKLSVICSEIFRGKEMKKV